MKKNTSSLNTSIATVKEETKVITLGCRLNYYESDIILNNAKRFKQKNTVIINTCAVTNEAERQSKQTIRKMRKLNPNSKIIATGCAVQLKPSEFLKMIEVDQVVGNEHKIKKEIFSKHSNSKDIVSDIMNVTNNDTPIIINTNNRARTSLEIQQGCNHRCTFCIIPFARGNNRSTPMGYLVDHIKRLVARGYSEITLTGVDICSYGSDLPGQPTLGQMLKRLFKTTPELPRLRLSSLDPAAIDNDLIEIIADEKRLLPYFHFSTQSGDNLILKRMKRRHSREDIIKIANEIKNNRPEVIFGCDIISGFPTETHKSFNNTMNLIDEVNFTKLHVFPFSPKKGTPAFRMPQVSKEIIKKRAFMLREKGNHNLNKVMQTYIGKKVKVLIEKNGLGYSETYLPVQVLQPTKTGELIEVKITNVIDSRLVAS